MEEDRVLFQIAKLGGATSVEMDCQGFDDLFAVCVCIANHVKEVPQFGVLLMDIINRIYEDEKFATDLQSCCAQLPDFESILKDKDHE